MFPYVLDFNMHKNHLRVLITNADTRAPFLEVLE